MDPYSSPSNIPRSSLYILILMLHSLPTNSKKSMNPHVTDTIYRIEITSGCGSKPRFVAGPPTSASVCPTKEPLSQRRLSKASRFCYKPMSLNCRPSPLQTWCFWFTANFLISYVKMIPPAFLCRGGQRNLGCLLQMWPHEDGCHQPEQDSVHWRPP